MSLVREYRRDLGQAFRETQSLAYVEMFFGIAILVLINLLFFRDHWGFIEVNPHPFWFVVLLIAARYGAIPGYAVGLLAALVYLIFVVTQPQSVFAVDLLSTEALLPPVLFFVVGAALGELRQGFKREQKRLATRYDEVETSLQDVAQRYLTAVEINRELERRIVSQSSTVTTLYQAAKALDKLDIDALAPAALELVRMFVEAESCALYLREGGRFVLRASHPAQVDWGRPAILDSNNRLVAAAVSNRRTATVRDVMAEATPAQIARERLLMATPLITGEGELLGLLAVERMPFLRFTPTAVRLFTLLGDWASSAFQNALRFQQVHDRNIADEPTGAYSYGYMTKRLAEEIARAGRYRLPLALLAVRVDDFVAIPPVRLPQVLQVLGTVLQHNIRPIDILGKYRTDDIYLIVLPHLTRDDSEAVGARIGREIAGFGFQPFGNDRPLTVTLRSGELSATAADPGALIDGTVASLIAPAGAGAR